MMMSDPNMTKELVEVVQADSCIVMGEGREGDRGRDMGQGIGALPSARAGHEPSQQVVSAVPVTIANACRNCDGGDWVCENHHDRPWHGTSNSPHACACGGAGSPCPVCQTEMANAPLIYSIAQEARRYAAFYAPGSDGRNTFEMFAEFVETRAIAQAIEARRAEAYESSKAEGH